MTEIISHLSDFQGIIIGLSAFLIIGLFHPVVIKTEYHTGTRYWWVFLFLGLTTIVASIFVDNITLSAILGVFGFSSLWTIMELFEQKERVRKGWFPKKPNKN